MQVSLLVLFKGTKMSKHAKISWGKLVKRLSPYNIKKACLYLKHYGFKEFTVKLTERFEHSDVDYPVWFDRHKASAEELERQREQNWKNPVKFSVVVPVYRTPEDFLRQMIESVCEQSYPHWELCLADGSGDDTQTGKIIKEYVKSDARIRYQKLEENLGIADNTNAAFTMAKGEFIVLFDHDDLLAPNALYEVAKAIEENQEAEVIYTDEDKVTSDLSEHFQPHFKPDFNLDLLRSNNYICHLFVVKRSLVEKAGGLRREFEGAQDYDFVFRCIEEASKGEMHDQSVNKNHVDTAGSGSIAGRLAICRGSKVIHVPKVLYHWRIHKASTADNPASKAYAFEAGKRAIEAHLNRCKVKGSVSQTKDMGFYRVSYEVTHKPLVSIIIPNKDHADILQSCLNSIKEKTTYPNYEVIIVENNSKEEETFAFYKNLDGQNRIQVVYWDKECRLSSECSPSSEGSNTSRFNYSAINNFGIAKSSGEYIICLNNDITVITPGWIEEFLGHAIREEVGIVGARLYYPDDTIQHAGIVLGIGGIAGSMFVGLPRSHSGYLHKARLQQDMSAVTAACMMVSRSVYEEVGGFEEKLAVAFNDVDFCLKVGKAGYLVVYDPFVEMYHHESKTRGPEDTKEKVRRFQSEIEYMRSHWISLLKQGDPYYNPNFSLKTWNYELKNEFSNRL